MLQLAKKLRKLLSKELVDIVIIGSAVKGKLVPADIDVLVVSETERLDIKARIKQIIPNADVQFLTLRDYDKFLWLTMIREGYSVKHNKYLHEIYGIKPVVLYKYSLKQLSASKKVMFERALKQIKADKLSNRIVLVPVEKSNEFSDFLKGWNIDLDAQEYFLMPLVRKE